LLLSYRSPQMVNLDETAYAEARCSPGWFAVSKIRCLAFGAKTGPENATMFAH
jgi:hypothetical protein